MKSIGTFTYYSLGSLAYLTATQADQIDPNTIISIQDGASSGIIWNDDQTLCLMASNKFLNKRGGDSSVWTSKWSAQKKQRKIDTDKATPRCEDTEVFWTNYCRNTIDSGHSGNEAEFLAQDPRAEQFLYRLSVHADLDNNFCIIPEGDYCLKENPGTYKLQKFVNSNGKLEFKFVPFDGVNPDFYFHFDDDNDLVYGNIGEGYAKLLISKNPKNSQKVKISKLGFTSNKDHKKYESIKYTFTNGYCCTEDQCILDSDVNTLKIYEPFRPPLDENLYQNQPCKEYFNDCNFLTVEEAQAIAESYGLSIGGDGFPFAVEGYDNKGLYIYPYHSKYAGNAYYGVGGDVYDQQTTDIGAYEVPGDGSQYRLPTYTSLGRACKTCDEGDFLYAGNCFRGL